MSLFNSKNFSFTCIYIYRANLFIYICSKFSISIHSQNGRTPLMLASFDGRVDIVRLLVEAKAQLNIRAEV